MSDDFIPLNQSTPEQGNWKHRNQNSKERFRYNNRFQSGQRRGHFRGGNNSQRNSSFGTDSNSSFGQDSRSSIDAYLHPSMLQDPWAHLQQNKN